MLETVKSLLGITDTSKDAILTHIISTVTARVRGYCNLTDEELPDALQLLIIDIVIDTFRARDYGQAQAEAVVTSVSEGDESVSFKVADKRNPDEIFVSYIPALNTYRQLR